MGPSFLGDRGDPAHAEAGRARTPRLDTLDQLQLPRAIATSSSHRTVERHLITHNLMERFEVIVGHGD